MKTYKQGKETTVGEAPVGLLELSCGEVICKSEYRHKGRCECTIVSSGEGYHGEGDEARCWPLVEELPSHGPGLYRKYVVERADGLIIPDAEYLCLRIDHDATNRVANLLAGIFWGNLLQKRGLMRLGQDIIEKCESGIHDEYVECPACHNRVEDPATCEYCGGNNG